MKYQLMLKDILKYSERANVTDDELNALKAAFHIMQVVPKSANDMMDVGRLQGFEVSVEMKLPIFHSNYKFEISRVKSPRKANCCCTVLWSAWREVPSKDLEAKNCKCSCLSKV